MATREIKTRFKLEGEQAFKKAMTEAASSIKVLNSEQRMAAAEFEATGDAQQYASEKARILKEQIEQQKKAVKAAEDAVSALTKNGVEPNSKQMQSWKTKLNDAKASLAKMESQLDKTEGEIKDQTSEATKAKTAYSSAEKKVKSLTEEEKLAAAQFKATGDKEQYLADKTRILKDKIEAQKKAVTAAETAIKSLTDNGVDPNAKEVQEWRDKLVAAKTGLLNLQNRLDHVGDEVNEETKAFGEAETGAGDLKNAIDKVGEKVDYQNVISAIDSITGHMEKVVKAAAKAAKAVWEMGVDAGKWADDLATAANEAGVDVETYQSWQYASRFIDTSVGDIVKSWQDIQKQMKEGNTDYLATLAQMGIASRTASDQVRSSEDIFWDAIDYLHGIGDEALRAEKATLLFGNDWRKLNPLINAGSRAYKDMADEGRSVAVVSQDNVEALGAVDDAMQDFNARFDKLKYDALAALAPTFQTIAEAMGKAVTALNEFIASEEGQQALAGLNEALAGLIDSFLGEDGGKGTFESIVNTAKDAVKGFTDAMDWLSKNGETVKGIIIGLGAAWATLKVSKEVLTFMQLLKSTPLANLKQVFGGGGSPGTPTGTPTGGSPAVPGAGASGAAAAGKAATTVGMSAAADVAVYGIGVPALVVGAAIAPAVIADNLDRARITERLNGIKEEAAAAAAAIGEEGETALEAVNTAADALGVSKEKLNIFGQGVLGDPEAIDQALDTLKALDAAKPFLSAQTRLMLERNEQTGGLTGMQENELLDAAMVEALESLTDPKVPQAAHDIKESISDAMDSILEVQEALDEGHSMEKEGSMYKLIRDMANDQDVIDSLSESTRNLLAAWLDTESGFGNGGPNLYSDSQDLLDAMLTDLGDAWDKAMEAGENVSDGFTEGIDAGAENAATAAGDMAQGAIDAAEATLDSHSPSRVFEVIGENAAVGLANGIYARGNDAINAARWLAQSVTNIVQSALQIHSPSKVFDKLGRFTGLGFAEGIESSAADVNRAVDAMISATTRRPAMTIGGFALEDGSAGGGRRATAITEKDENGMVHVTLVLDEEVLGDVMAPIVNDKIGAKIQATRR